MNTALVEFLRSDVETGDWFLSCALEKCWLVAKKIGSARMDITLPQATHMTQHIADGVGVGHSRKSFLNICVIAIKMVKYSAICYLGFI
jgi:hypothetical protein